MQHSESIASIAAAFVKAQGVIETASKDAENPAFKRNGKATRYADLGAVWDACKSALQDNDIGVVQAPGLYVDGCASMTTMLVHKSGEWIKETMSIPTRGDAQGYGSGITYARRYALAAMLGVISEEDDDGNKATQKPDGNTQNTVAVTTHEVEARKPVASSPPPASAMITDEQRAVIQTLAPASGRTTQGICELYNISSLKELTKSQAAKLIERLQGDAKAKNPLAAEILEDEIPY